jgi:small subunit ribosomal protein S2
LEKNLGSIADMARLPAALFVIDIMKEHIAVSEARRLNLPIFGMVDTNSDPELIDFPIPANDDAANSIAIVLDTVVQAIREGNNERKLEKDNDESASQVKKTKKTTKDRSRVAEDDDAENKKSSRKLTRKVKNIEEDEK